MIADSERREVAARLRGIKDKREGCGHELCCDLWDAIFDNDYRCTDLCDECEVAVLDSLADLIEPGEPKVKCVAEVKVDGERLEQLVHDAAVELTGIDRDALLALADNLYSSASMLMKQNDLDTNRKRRGMRRDHAKSLMAASDRIREALGVSE